MFTKVVILAAGKGTRMKSELPKVLVPFRGEPMIKRLVASVIESGVDTRPVIVVSPTNADLIKEALKGHDCLYAVQGEQLGTGHALLSAQEALEGAERVLVFCGDHPFVRQETVRKLSEARNDSVSMAVVEVEDFEDWRKVFFHWGRVIRENDVLKEIIEFKDASEHIREIKSVNPSFYCFNAEWLRNNIAKLQNNNIQKEYYLTDLIKLAFEEKRIIESFAIEPQQAIGINSVEDLEIAEGLFE